MTINKTKNNIALNSVKNNISKLWHKHTSGNLASEMSCVSAIFRELENSSKKYFSTEKKLKDCRAILTSKQISTKNPEPLSHNTASVKKLKQAQHQFEQAKQNFKYTYDEVLKVFHLFNEELAKSAVGYDGTHPLIALDREGREINQVDATSMVDIKKVRIRGYHLEEQISRLLSQASVSRAAEEKDSIQFRRISDDLFDHISNRTKALGVDLAAQKNTLIQMTNRLNSWRLLVEAKPIHEAYSRLSPTSKTLPHEIEVVRESICSLQRHCLNINHQLMALEQKFCTKTLKSKFHQATYNVTKDFDRSFVGRYAWTVPIALIASGFCALVLVVWESPALNTIGLSYCIFVFGIALAISTAAGNSRRKALMKDASSDLVSRLKKVIPGSMDTGAEGHFQFPIYTLAEEPNDTATKRRFKPLQKIKGALKIFLNGKRRLRMWVLNILAAVAPAFLLSFIAFALHSSLPDTQLLGSALKSAGSNVPHYPTLAIGRLLSSSDGVYRIQKKCSPTGNWCWHGYSMFSTTYPKQQVTYLIDGKSDRSRSIADKQTNAVTIELSEKSLKGLGAYLTPPNKKSSDSKISLVSPVIIQTPKQTIKSKTATNSIMTTLIVDGITNEKSKKQNAILIPIFFGPVTAGNGFVDSTGNVKYPFQSDGESSQQKGIGTLKEALIFGLASLFDRKYADNPTRPYSVEKNLLNTVTDFIGKCIKTNEEPIKISVFGYSTSDWRDAIGSNITKQQMNLALAEGRRLAVIAHILRRLKNTDGISENNMKKVIFNQLNEQGNIFVSTVINNNGFINTIESLKTLDGAVFKKHKFVFSNYEKLLAKRVALIGYPNKTLEKTMSRSAVLQFDNLSELSC
ncbi:MAG: hypothetical protein V3V04_05990 [Rhizobiaceae bacterium]